MGAIEIIGLVLGIVAIIFAFEAPRKKFIALFRKSAPVEHEFKVRTVFYAHNDGKPLGPLGANKTEKKYVLVWVIRNRSENPLQIERGILMRQRDRTKPLLTLTVPQFTGETIILPGHRLELLAAELTPSEVDHYRHWIRECDAFGIKNTSGTEYWIPDPDFQKFSGGLEKIAAEYGLAKEVPEGKEVVLKIVRPSNPDLNPEERK